ncbi:hypothetical protein [Rhizobium ruizarguesonis]
MRRLEIVILSILLMLSFSSSAHAYVDPGSGSIVASAILGFFAAIAYTFRKTFYRIKDAIVGRSKPSVTTKEKDDF